MHRVLVCDNAAIVQFVLQRYLKNDDCEVGYAKTPRDLVRIIDSYKPDVLFLEAEISEGKGRYLCEFLSRRPSTKGIPIILSTRLSETTTTTFNMESWPGVVALIRKPLLGGKVKKAIHDALKGKGLSKTREAV
ncbi:MAG: hypothetical protein CR997_01480 [Acidobacteria bacterium]|nr:MAG: hypothetical protein CR997_01480 [Acidobacteriota bacterium]